VNFTPTSDSPADTLPVSTSSVAQDKRLHANDLTGAVDAPLISVVMPVYNCGRYVAQAVESILAQTLADFEFVVIDDGSTDKTSKVLRRYAARDPRIRIVSRPNRGLVASLNEGLALALGEFIARMDGDDIALPSRFERQVAFLRQHPDIVCVGSAVLEIDEVGRELVVSPQPLDDETIQELSLKGLPKIWHPTAMMRREAVHSIGGYRPGMCLGEDLDLWLRLGEHGRLANLEEYLLLYRIHSESYTSQWHDERDYYLQKITDEACDRRGIARRFEAISPFRMGKGRRSKHECAVRHGWWVFMRGNRSGAIHYALRAIWSMPLERDGWHLLACSLLKPVGQVT
jgi:glycosyltransferase involved in cell wall biosynthesis